MRDSMRAEAVAREESPRARSVARCFSSGGVEGEWVVERRTERRRERVFGLESMAAFDAEALSLITPIRSLITFPMDTELERRERERGRVKSCANGG